MSASNHDQDAAAISKQIDHLTRALKAPRIPEAAARLGDQAGDAGWTPRGVPRCRLGPRRRRPRPPR